jgi:predicted MFS family arabinose efflux permease
MAGLLIATAGRKVGSGTAFALDALSFAFASLMLVLVRYDHRVVAVAQVGEQAPDRDGSGLWQSVFEGLRYCWSDPVLRALLVIIAATNFAFTGPFTVGLASLAHSRFAGGSVAFGIMLSGWGAGAVVGTLAGGSLGQPRRRGRIVLIAVVLLGAGLVALGFVPNVVIATAAIVAMGCGGGFINVIMLPWLQTRADPRFVGRVMSVVMFAAVALAPISYALAGLLVDVNAEILFAAAGGLVLGAAIIAGAREPVRSID